MIDQVITKLIFDLLVRTVVERAITVLPFLAWPFFNPLFLAIIRRASDAIYKEAKKGGIEFYIGVNSDIEKTKYDQAVEKLKESFNKSEEERRIADEEFKNRLRDIVRMRPLGLRQN